MVYTFKILNIINLLNKTIRPEQASACRDEEKNCVYMIIAFPVLVSVHPP